MRNLTDGVFRTAGTTFKVLEVENYPAMKVSRHYRGILAFKPGILVAVGFRGTCIPNITSVGGVVRLTKVKVDDKTYDHPRAISEALGIELPMVPYPLEEL